MNILAVLCQLAASAPPATPAAVRVEQSTPKIIVVISVNLLRADFLTRWQKQFSGGFGLLQSEGAWFTNAFQDHAISETAPGTAVIASGRWPRHTGIVSNGLGVQDSVAPLLGRGPGASPWRFKGTALFDWLHAKYPQSVALAVSRKDRGAIPLIGKAKQHAYWYFGGLFTTSSYYADTLPSWVQAFNAQQLPYRSAGTAWRLLLPENAYAEPDGEPWENAGRDATFPHFLPDDSVRAASALGAYPQMDSLTLAFTLRGVDALRLGRRGVPDYLAVSLSATDAIGHAFGPSSREMHDAIVRVDRMLGWFFNELFGRVGRDGVLIVLTGEHGITPFPEETRTQGGATFRVSLRAVDSLVDEVNKALRVGPSDGPMSFSEGMLMVEREKLNRMGIQGERLTQDVAVLRSRLSETPGIARVQSLRELAEADTATDAVARRWLHTLDADRQDVLLVSTLRDGSIWDYANIMITAHGQPSDADTHVPILFWGLGVRKGTYTDRVSTVDIAPTLAFLAGLTPLENVDGRILRDALLSVGSGF